MPGLLGLLFYGLTVTVMMRIKPSLAVPGQPTSWREKLGSLAGLVPFFAVFLIIVMFIGTRQIRTRRPMAHIARGVLWYGSLFFVFFALRQMSIAEVNAYLFIEALLTVMLAVVILGEKLTPRKIVSRVPGTTVLTLSA